MDTALVTGGAGFIGSHVVDALLQMRCRVVVLDDLSGGMESNVTPSAKLIVGNICDVNLMEETFARYRFDYVYHLAAYAAEGLSHFIRRFNYTNNLVGTMTLLNASIRHHVKCFVFTSSIAVYGRNQSPMTEEMVPCPEDPYGIAKLAVEQDLRAAHEMFGLNYVIFRPHNVYGERQNIGDPYRNVIGIFMNQIMQAQELPIFGDGSQTRAFSYVGDVAPWIARAAHTPGALNQVFNVGADQPCTVGELADMVCAEFGVPPRLKFLPARNEVPHAFSDHHKLHSVFGHKPATPLREGLQRMAAWARKEGPRRSKPFHGIEITEKLPSIWVRERGAGDRGPGLARRHEAASLGTRAETR
jgi:UDP-glucose 4-epimerase